MFVLIQSFVESYIFDKMHKNGADSLFLVAQRTCMEELYRV